MIYFGNSAQGLPIFSYSFGQKGPEILLVGGVHGDEPEGMYLAMGLLERFLDSFTYNLKITLIPVFNPDGALTAKRTNGNQVDLNRNLPTKSWTANYENPRYNPGPSAGSEPENQALLNWLETHNPKLIISFHSWNPMINTNGNCQPEAGILAETLNYKVSDDIGYPTPGSLGEYCGLERNIPTITYEVEKGLPAPDVLKYHIPAVEKALQASQKRI